MASFVLYKLYTDANLKYPPFKIDTENMSAEEIEKKLANVEALTIGNLNLKTSNFEQLYFIFGIKFSN